MSAPVTLGSITGGVAPPASPPPRNVAEAARQFEALLIAQLLKAAHGEDQGWLGTGEDTGDSTASSLAEEQFAQALAQSGGLGLSSQIVSKLLPGTK